MMNKCNNCNLMDVTEQYKKRLIGMIVGKSFDLLDDEVIKLVQLLDILVGKCVSCKNNLNCIPNIKK